MTCEPKKRQQHYVWKYLLRAWSDNGAVWCRMADRCFRVNVDRVAKQRDFYRMRELTHGDIRFLIAYIEKADNESLRKLNFGWLCAFRSFTNYKQFAEKNGFENPDVARKLEKLEINLEENLHNGIEELAKPYLELAKEGDLSFLNDKASYQKFIYFLAVQYLRTARNKERTLPLLTNAFGVNFERIWGVFTHIAATNVSSSLIVDRNRYNAVLLVAPDGRQFITGDQPVINTYANPDNVHSPPDNFDMYFPISPRLALYLTDRAEWAREDTVLVTQDRVAWFNGMMAKHSHRQLFGASKEAIE